MERLPERRSNTIVHQGLVIEDPTIEPDPTGAAPGGIITGGRLLAVSIDPQDAVILPPVRKG